MTLAIGSGETETIGPGETTYTESVDLEGELDLEGDLSLTDAADGTLSATAGSDLFVAGDALRRSDTVAFTAGVSLLAVGNISTFLPHIPPDRFHRVRAAETTYSPRVDLEGELYLEGELNLTDTADDAVALDAGAVLTPTGAPVALGVATFEAAGDVRAAGGRIAFGAVAAAAGASMAATRSIMFQRTSMEAGADLSASSSRIRSSGVDFAAGSALDARGTAFAETATAAFSAGADLSSSATLIRDAGSVTFLASADLGVDGRPVRLDGVRLAAGGELDTAGMIVEGAIRRDDADLVYDDSDEFDLSLDER